MSQNEQKKDRTVDMDFSALETELAQLAEETPDMPEDFHEKWTQAIRKEAAARQDEKELPDTISTEGKRTDVRKQRRYILSAAAAFVLIIGGVWLLGGDELKKLSDDNPFSRVKTDAASVVQVEDISVPETDTVPEAAADMEEAAAAPDADAGGTVSGAEDSAMGQMNAAGAGGTAGEASYKAAVKTAEEAEPVMIADEALGNAAASYDYAEETDSAADRDVPEGNSPQPLFAGFMAAHESASSPADGVAADSEAAEDAEAEEYAAEEATVTPEPTSVPTPEPTVEPTAEPMPEPTAAPETEEAAVPEAVPAAAENGNQAVEEGEPSFLQRLWNKFLQVTPWALGIIVVVLFLVTYVIRAKQRRKKQSGKADEKHV